MDRQRKLLHEMKPRRRTALLSDFQKVTVGEEEQQEWSFKLDQEDPEPPHIKEEQEELWISQEGKQLQGLQVDDIKFPFTPVPVKSEDDEEECQSPQLHQRQTEQMKTEADGEDYEGPEPARETNPDRQQPDTEDESGDSSEPETDDSDDWKDTRGPLNSLNNYDVPASHLRCNAAEKPFSCSECGKAFGTSGHLNNHMRSHTGEKPFSCLFCKTSFTQKGNLQTHMRVHTREKPFGCSVCKKYFTQRGTLQIHMRSHTGEKPYSCSVCGKRFPGKCNLVQHMKSHAEEKPFSCSVCKKSFTLSGHLQTHMRIHTGEKPFSCSVCDQRFTWYNQLKRHKCVGRQSSQLHQTQTEENREAEPPASSSTEQMETEADGEDCGGPELARNSDLDAHLQPNTDDKIGDSAETPDSVGIEFWKETRQHHSGFTYGRNKKVADPLPILYPSFTSSCYDDKAETEPNTDDSVDSDFYKQTRQPQSGLNHLKIMEVSVSDIGCNTDKKPFSSSECHERSEKPFRCSVCNTGFVDSEALVQHMRIHTIQTQFSCPICGEEFAWRRYLTKHMEVHKIYSCRDCDKKFIRHYQLKYHRCVGCQSSQLHQTQTEENREAKPPASSYI